MSCLFIVYLVMSAAAWTRLSHSSFSQSPPLIFLSLHAYFLSLHIHLWLSKHIIPSFRQSASVFIRSSCASYTCTFLPERHGWERRQKFWNIFHDSWSYNKNKQTRRRCLQVCFWTFFFSSFSTSVLFLRESESSNKKKEASCGLGSAFMKENKKCSPFFLVKLFPLIMLERKHTGLIWFDIPVSTSAGTQ